jgi:hypothetical protein
MTLAELLPAVEQLPAADKLKLIRILAETLDDANDIAPLVPHKVYELPTPYGMHGAARLLVETLEKGEGN